MASSSQEEGLKLLSGILFLTNKQPIAEPKPVRKGKGTAAGQMLMAPKTLNPKTLQQLRCWRKVGTYRDP